MKIFTLLFVLTLSIAVNAQSYEIESKKDTFNLIDANAKKQGKWIIRGMHKPHSGYMPEQKIEEGWYKNNRKIGVWVEYYTNSNLKSKITFVDGRPHGPSTMYYENGNIKEDGTWSNNRWVGNYKSNLENGDVIEIIFDDKGKELSKKITPAKKELPSKKK